MRDALRTTRLATHPDRRRDQEEMATEASKYVAVAGGGAEGRGPVNLTHPRLLVATGGSQCHRC